MTGGQDPVGGMTLPRLASLLLDEGVSRVVVTTDDVKRAPTRWACRARSTSGTATSFSKCSANRPPWGVTVLVHDQYCAAEKRRRRKRGVRTPAQRVMINERICRGCGDCGEKSNCLSVHPVDTEFGLEH